MLRRVLEFQGRTHASVASYNNHWGVPLTLARMPADTQFAIFEVGMNHPGEIAPLSEMVQPHVALITTVAPAHMEAFESLEGIAREKADIPVSYTHLRAHETKANLVCRLLLEKKKQKNKKR